MDAVVAASDAATRFMEFASTKLSFAPGLRTVARVAWLAARPWDWTPLPAALFLACTYVVMTGRRRLPAACPPGTEVVLVTVAATLWSSRVGYDDDHAVVGEMPTLDPDAGMTLFGGALRLPVEIESPLRLATEVGPLLVERVFNGSLARLALAAALSAAVNFLQTVGVASSFASEDGVAWSPTRELLAQGVANAAAGVTGSAPVGGSLSRSLVARASGATSRLCGAVTALCWIFALPWTSVVAPTPKAALSAVVVGAVLRGVARPKDLLTLDRPTDKAAGWITGLTVALVNPTIGFGAGLAAYASLYLVFGAGPSRKKKTT